MAAATIALAAPAAAPASTSVESGGGCATHIDTPEPLGVNVLGIVCI